MVVSSVQYSGGIVAWHYEFESWLSILVHFIIYVLLLLKVPFSSHTGAFTDAALFMLYILLGI